MDEMMIDVGIPVRGNPDCRSLTSDNGEQLNALRNQLIGVGFHWECEISTLLPGEVRLFTPTESSSHTTPDKSSDSEDINKKDIHKEEIPKGGIYKLVNRLPLERYLECVVGSEMNPNAPIEFLKAHAIISRSWVAGKLRRFKKHPDAAQHVNRSHTGNAGKLITTKTHIDWEDNHDHSGFDVCSDDHCQRYQGIQPIPQAMISAIRSTSGLVLATRHPACEEDMACDSNIAGKESSAGGWRIVDARFSKCCGGHTEIFPTCWQDVMPDAIEGFADPWCDLSNLSDAEYDRFLHSALKDYDLNSNLNSNNIRNGSDNSYFNGGYSWEYTLSKNLIEANLKQKLNRDIGKIQKIEVLERGVSGRIKLLKLHGTKGALTIGKELIIRKIFADDKLGHLYSSAFEIEDMGSNLHLRGKGWGHGVGLCQLGAARMAFEGKSCLEILSFYYPGSEIINLKNIAN